MFSGQNRIFRNRSRRYSTPSAQVIASLGPLKSSNQAIFNGSKLDIGTARGAKNGNYQNCQTVKMRKHAKNATDPSLK